MSSRDITPNEKKLKKPKVGVIAKKNNINIVEFIPIMLFIVAYGICYFIFRDSLPFTPDYASSDAFHLNVSLKYFLWDSLRKGIFPFWTDKLAGGFPIMAESQIGALFLPNLLLLPLFSQFSNGYIFLHFFHLFILTIGMYGILRNLKITIPLSFILAMTFSWCGAISFRWIHFNFLQTFSLFPLLFWSYFKWKDGKKYLNGIVISFMVSQMIFAGHMQTTFNALLALAFTHILLTLPLKINETIKLAGFILLGFILAFPQIIPTTLLSIYSSRGVINNYQYIVQYVFSLRDLIGFYSSQAFGTPLSGIYGGLVESGYRIYWENTPYMGEIFILTILTISIVKIKNIVNDNYVKVFGLLCIIFLILSFGSSSPLYFIFSIFPFNVFRTPAKYLLMVVFFLSIYSGVIINQLVNKNQFLKIFIYAALLINSYLLIATAFNYNIFINNKKLFTSVKNTNLNLNTSSYITTGGDKVWNVIFKSKKMSVSEKMERFIYLNQMMQANSNLISGLSIFDVNTGGLKIRRNDFIKSMILTKIAEFEEKNSSVEKELNLESLLQLYNISSIVSINPLFLTNNFIEKIVSQKNIAIRYYKMKDFESNVLYVPSSVKSIKYIEDLKSEIELKTPSETYSLAENIHNSIIQKGNDIHINSLSNSDQNLKANVSTGEDIFIVAKKGWYPEWNLTIDGKNVPIYRTNLIHMGFYFPKGKHTIEFSYVPLSFYGGCGVTFFLLLGIFLIFLKRIKRS